MTDECRKIKDMLSRVKSNQTDNMEGNPDVCSQIRVLIINYIEKNKKDEQKVIDCIKILFPEWGNKDCPSDAKNAINDAIKDELNHVKNKKGQMILSIADDFADILVEKLR